MMTMRVSVLMLMVFMRIIRASMTSVMMMRSMLIRLWHMVRPTTVMPTSAIMVWRGDESDDGAYADVVHDVRCDDDEPHCDTDADEC